MEDVETEDKKSFSSVEKEDMDIRPAEWPPSELNVCVALALTEKSRFALIEYEMNQSVGFLQCLLFYFLNR